MIRIIAILATLTFAMVLMTGFDWSKATKAAPEAIEAELAKLAPVEIRADASYLSEADRSALDKLVEASKIMDELFLAQSYSKNFEIQNSFRRSGDPDNDPYQRLFRIMFGPFNHLEEYHPFIGDEAKPLGANYYPEDMTKEEFSQWIADHPEDEASFKDVFTIIRRREGALVAIPYSEAYKELLEKAAVLIEEAAVLTGDVSLMRYLSSRATSFRTNDYFQSDMDWMDLAGDIEVVIGPYEVYEDRLFGYKGAFESFVTLVDRAESQKLDVVAKYIDEMEGHLPIPDEHKNFERGSSSPIKVVNVIYTAGDTKAGIQTSAFNLPNDERVREAKGSKKVMLKNVMEGKFEKCWKPITKTVMAPKALEDVAFDAYFNETLMHEMSHGIGPGTIELADGTMSTVSAELKALYSTIEECKADVLSIYNTDFLLEKGVLDEGLRRTTYNTYLGGIFRSVRFGIDEAHGGGMIIQFNWLMEKGAFAQDKEGRFYSVPDKVGPAIESLARELLMIEAVGDYEGAKKLIDQYRVMTPVMATALARLEGVPIDICPIYEAD
ncbi:peptidase [Thermodesulfobacteriota bacterium]